MRILSKSLQVPLSLRCRPKPDQLAEPKLTKDPLLTAGLFYVRPAECSCPVVGVRGLRGPWIACLLSAARSDCAFEGVQRLSLKFGGCAPQAVVDCLANAFIGSLFDQHLLHALLVQPLDQFEQVVCDFVESA